MLNDEIKVTGKVNLYRYNKEGVLLETRLNNNLVVTAGKNFLAQWLAANSQAGKFMNYMQLGTLGTTLAAAATGGTSTTVQTNTDILSGITLPASIVLNPGPNPATPNADTETVSIASKSGTGPYTYTIASSGHTANNHSIGENVVLATTAADTALGTALGASATAGTNSYSGNTWTNTCSLTGTAGNVTEAGIFSAATSGTMFAHVVFAAINLASSDTLQIVWNVTFS